MDGGKHYNRVQAGSFKYQSMAASLRVQYGPGWVDPVLNKMGIQLGPLSAFALRRKQQHEKDSPRKLFQRYKKWRLDSKHQSSSNSPDSSYGNSPAEPGPNPEELLRLCQEHLDRFSVTADEIRWISVETVDQSDDQSWGWTFHRQCCVPASSFGAITKRKASFAPLVIRLRYGRQAAYLDFLQKHYHKDAAVERTGFHIDKEVNI